MVITCFIPFILLIISLLISYLWIVVFNSVNFLFIMPIILIIFALFYTIELKIISKYKINKTLYNITSIQIPAIICIICALVLWLLHSNELLIIIFLSTGKYILAPILCFRLIIEVVQRKKNNLAIITMGITLGVIIGFLAINFL